MIDRLLANRGGDWIEDVADALPMTVIGDIIGIPESDRPEIFGVLDRILTARSPEAQLSRQDEIDLYTKIFGYAMELTAEKRRNPADDIWSTLASAVITEDLSGFPPTNSRILLLRAHLRRQRLRQERAGHRAAGVRREPEQIERYRGEEALRASAFVRRCCAGRPVRTGRAPRSTSRWTASTYRKAIRV
jgi:hypothetical protein